LSRQGDGLKAKELWRRSDLSETYSPAVYLDGFYHGPPFGGGPSE